MIAAPERGLDAAVLAALGAGAVLLALFVREEGRSRAPMMPLGLFRSRTFSGVNALTLLLYAGLGGAFFFLPFLLIQVHGFSATLAGASFLPFTGIMASLSRWSGGLIDRFGARLPLVIGPAGLAHMSVLDFATLAASARVFQRGRVISPPTIGTSPGTGPMTCGGASCNPYVKRCSIW